MISKISFFKMVKSECRRRVWILAILFVLFAGALPVTGLMQLQNYDTSDTSVYTEYSLETQETDGTSDFTAGMKEQQRIEKMQDSFEGMVGKGNAAVMGITLAGAILTGISGFSYLHSRKKMDFYHSIPLRRERLFLIQQVSSFILYLLPLLGNYLLMLMIGGIKGALWTGTWLTILQGLAVQIVSFFLIYETVVLGMMLTGKLLVAILGIGVLFAYFPGIVSILEGYANFFRTYTGTVDFGWEWLRYCTPLYSVYWSQQEKGNSWLLLIFLAAGFMLMGISLFLYKIRSTEAAEQSMAFPKSQSVIKWMLVLALSLGSGLIMSQIAVKKDSLWLFFGILVGVILASGITEIVYSYDFRRAFSHRLQLLLMVIVAVGVGSVFRFDLLGYDTWIPQKDQVESMAVSAWSWIPVSSYWVQEEGDFVYEDQSSYLLEHMKITDFENLLQLAQEGTENARVPYGEMEEISMIQLRYNLKNGRIAERQYEVSNDILSQTMEQLVCTREYQDAVYQILDIDPQVYRRISVMDKFGDIVIYGDRPEDMQKLVEAYQEDLQAQEFESWKQAEVLGTLTLTAGRLAQEANWDYPIDSTFTKTLEVLESMGVHLVPLSQEPITNIQIINMTEDSIESTGGPIIISSQEEIQQLLPLLVPARNGWGNSKDYQLEYGFQVSRADEFETVFAYLKKGVQLPEFLEM